MLGDYVCVCVCMCVNTCMWVKARVCMLILCVWMLFLHICVRTMCVQRTEKDIRSPAPGVTDGCELPPSLLLHCFKCIIIIVCVH